MSQDQIIVKKFVRERTFSMSRRLLSKHLTDEQRYMHEHLDSGDIRPLRKADDAFMKFHDQSRMLAKGAGILDEAWLELHKLKML